MANRVTVPTTNFETLSPPWSLTSLDADFLALQGALNDSSLGYVISGTDTGTANNYVVATPAFGTPSAYQTGMSVAFVPAHTNTGSSSTLAVSGLSPQAILVGTNQVLPGQIAFGSAVLMTYMGSSFQLIASSRIPILASSNAPGSSYVVNCQGAFSVSVYLSWNATTTTGIGLTLLPGGIPVSIVLFNNSSGYITYSITVTDPSGNTITPYVNFPTSTNGSAPVALNAPLQLYPGCVLSLSGAANAGTIFFGT